MENNNDDQSHSLNEEKSNEQKINQNQWCFSYYAGHEHADFNEKAGLLKGAKWQPGDVITISFLNGDPELHDKVIKSANKWVEEGMANLNLQFRLDTNDTCVRISFDRPGSWSVLGTTCKQITDQNQPTMNFGWITKNSLQNDIDRVVLHEFGHAIGLIHEHMIPEVGIKWNKAQIIRDLKGAPNNWSDQTIENNIFRTFEINELELTNLDKESIMMYPIPAKWTLDGFSTVLNTKLSQTDINFIRIAYPGNNKL